MSNVSLISLSADNLSRTPVSGSDDINDMESPVFSIHKSLSKNLPYFIVA